MSYINPVVYKRQGGAKGKRGHRDKRLRRSTGPLCQTCGRRHWPWQNCWTGPRNARRDWKAIHAELDAMGDDMQALADALLSAETHEAEVQERRRNPDWQGFHRTR